MCVHVCSSKFIIIGHLVQIIITMMTNFVRIFLILLYVVKLVLCETTGCIHWRSTGDPLAQTDVTTTLRINCSICTYEYKSETLLLPPYSGTRFTTLMSSVIQSCCDSCSGFDLKHLLPRWQLDSNVLSTVLLQSDIVYPVFAYSNSIEVYGNYFIPFYDPAGAVLVTGTICFFFVSYFTTTLFFI